MRNLPILISRELSARFVSPLFWVLLIPFMAYNGITFYLLMYLLSQPGTGMGAPMEAFFGGSILFFFAIFFICAVLTMGTLASERRAGTIETLMTAPVTDMEVVVSKFVACWVTYTLLWAPVLLYAFVISRYGDLEWGPVFSGFLGTLLQGGCYLSIGMLASALTKSQVIAAVVGFFGITMLFVVGLIEYVGLGLEPSTQAFFHHFNVHAHMLDWGKGLVDTRFIAYYGTVMVFCLFCAVRVLETRRWR